MSAADHAALVEHTRLEAQRRHYVRQAERAAAKAEEQLELVELEADVPALHRDERSILARLDEMHRQRSRYRTACAKAAQCGAMVRGDLVAAA